MNMSIKITDGDRSLSEWLAERVRIDVMEKYGIEVEIEVTYEGANGSHAATMGIKDNSTVTDIMSRLQDKAVLKPKDIQVILGMSQKKLYEFLSDAPFRVVRVGRELKIPNTPFKEWLLGK
jgi:hypothetical protein